VHVNMLIELGLSTRHLCFVACLLAGGDGGGGLEALANPTHE